MSCTNENGTQICPICLDREADVMPSTCTHAFCRVCLSSWIHQPSSTCPLCRGDMRVEIDIPGSVSIEKEEDLTYLLDCSSLPPDMNIVLGGKALEKWNSMWE